MLAEYRLDVIINFIILCPNRQYLPWSIDYIRCGLIESKCIITSIQEYIVVVKENGLKTNTLISNGFCVVCFLPIINITNGRNILRIEIFASMLECQVVLGNMKFHLNWQNFILASNFRMTRIVVSILQQLIDENFLTALCKLLFERIK